MDRLCRICLAPESVETFRDFFTPSRDFAQKLFYLTNITIFEVSNKLPALICSRCVDNLTRACKIKKLALETDTFFRQTANNDDLKILTDVMNGVKYKIIKQEHPEEIEEVPDESLNVDSPEDFHQANDDQEYTLDEMIDFSLSNIKVEALEGNENFELSLDLSEADILRPTIQKDETFNPSNLNKKLKRGSKIFKCDVEGCGKVFNRPYQYRDHREKAHQIKEIPGNENQVKDQKDKAFNIWLNQSKQLKGSKIFKCDVEGCERVFNRPYRYRDHREKAHQIKETPGDYNEAKLNSPKIKQPKKKSSGGNLYACTFEGCTKVYNRPYKLRDHIERHIRPPKEKKAQNPNKERKLHVCDIDGCTRFFRRPFELENHKQTHTNERNFGCEICGKLFRSPHEVKSHQRSVHANNPHYCDICGYVCHKKSNLLQHIEVRHLKIKKKPKQVCHLCGKELHGLQTLKLHMLYTHGGEKKFKCHICEKAFFSKGKLTQHLDALHGERPWVCEICAKTFSRRYKLGEHMKQTHKLGVKKFDCTLCGVQFDRVKLLQAHMRDKHEVVVEEEENFE